MGELSEGEMRELLSRAAIYIATSKYEPFGLAPLEGRTLALRDSWPTISRTCGRSGAMRPAIFAALTRIRSEKRWPCCMAIAELRLSYANRAYERARQHYTAQRMVEEYVQVYRALLERRVGAA